MINTGDKIVEYTYDNTADNYSLYNEYDALERFEIKFQARK